MLYIYIFVLFIYNWVYLSWGGRAQSRRVTLKALWCDIPCRWQLCRSHLALSRSRVLTSWRLPHGRFSRSCESAIDEQCNYVRDHPLPLDLNYSQPTVIARRSDDLSPFSRALCSLLNFQFFFFCNKICTHFQNNFNSQRWKRVLVAMFRKTRFDQNNLPLLSVGLFLAEAAQICSRYSPSEQNALRWRWIGLRKSSSHLYSARTRCQRTSQRERANVN